MRLKRLDAHAGALEHRDRVHRRASAVQVGDAGDVELKRGAPDGVAVGAGALAGRGVDHERQSPLAHEVDDIGLALADLGDARGLEAVARQEVGGAARGDQGESKLAQGSSHGNDLGLVLVAYAHEHRAGSRPTDYLYGAI